MNDIPKARRELNPRITRPNAVGVISNVHQRGFGFIIFAQRRIWFHLQDSDGTVFQPNDKVSFDLGVDSQGRPRGFNVKLVLPETQS
jgi:cold shock CspA family protein